MCWDHDIFLCKIAPKISHIQSCLIALPLMERLAFTRVDF